MRLLIVFVLVCGINLLCAQNAYADASLLPIVAVPLLALAGISFALGLIYFGLHYRKKVKESAAAGGDDSAFERSLLKAELKGKVVKLSMLFVAVTVLLIAGFAFLAHQEKEERANRFYDEKKRELEEKMAR